MILNKQNGKIYLGRTAKPGNRRRSHFSELRRRVHNNPRLQAAFNKYGEQSFVFEVIANVETGGGKQAEAHWFAQYGFDKRLLYNCHFETYGGPSCFGPMPEQIKQKISEAIKSNTRPKAYEMLDAMANDGISLREACRRSGLSSSTLLRYKRERVAKEDIEIYHPQCKASSERVAIFAEAFKKNRESALSRFSDFRVSRKALAKYLPEHGIDPKEVRFDRWRTEASERANQAVQMTLNTGCSASQAIKACGATNTAYYRRLKEVKQELGLLRLSTTAA